MELVGRSLVIDNRARSTHSTSKTTGDRRESNPHQAKDSCGGARSDFELRTPDDARQKPIRVGMHNGPGRIRTCDFRLESITLDLRPVRRAKGGEVVLYPLSYRPHSHGHSRARGLLILRITPPTDRR